WTALRSARAPRRARGRRLRQPFRRIPRHQRSPREALVLAGATRLRVPRPRALLAAPPRSRARALALPDVPCAAAGDAATGAGRPRPALPLRGRGDPRLL